MSIEQVFIWTCDKCKEEARMQHYIYPDYHAYIPEPPEGWFTLAGYTFCPKHKILVLVDGESLDGDRKAE